MGQPIIRYYKTDLYDRLVDEHGTFENYYDLLVFLAVVGYHENKIRRNNFKGSSSDGTKGEAGLRNVHSKELYRTVMACLAFHHTSDPEALVDADMQMETLAKYSAGGLEVIEQEISDVAGDPTDAILSYIERNEGGDSGIGGELGKIVESFDDQMMGIED